MGLKIRSIELFHFRNYDRFELHDVGNLTIFIGRNAIGKTNVLEGIQLLTSTTSFRHPLISQLIQDGSPFSRISLESGDQARSLETTLVLEEGKKRYEVNGKPRKAIDVRGMMPSIAFIPDDLQIAKKTSGVKRDALDDLGVQLTKNYYIIRKDFEKALRYKNRLLKEEASPSLIAAINETFATCAAQLFCYRYVLFNKMIPLVSQKYGEISSNGESFRARYVASWDHIAGNREAAEGPGGEMGDVYADRKAVRTLILEEMEKLGNEERSRHRCLIGPQGDKLYFELDGRDVSQFASQGQQRSIVLAWKLSEVEMVRRTLGTEPVLLLDDVMSELDEMRRDMLVSHVERHTQTFMTATDLAPFNRELLDMARVVDLEKMGDGRW